MRIHITTGPTRKKPKAGDEKTVKGVTYVRQHVRMHGGVLKNNGRYVYEWVVKEKEARS